MQKPSIEQVMSIAREALTELKAKEMVVIDVRGKSTITDELLIASGTSKRHVCALAENVVEKCKHAGFQPLGVEGEKDGEWALVDLGDIVVHVMQPATRALYDLEKLWSVSARPDESSSADAE